MRKKLRMCIGLLRLLKEKVWNITFLHLHGIKYYVGPGVRIYTNRKSKSVIDLGIKTWIDRNCYFSSSGGGIKIGYNNFFNSNIKVISKNRITIGDNNLFGPNVVIVDHDHKFDNPNELICKQGFTSSPIIIGSDIWLGANVVVCQGVKICDHVVVAANAVVTKTIGESGVYGGIPAKKIKSI